MRTECLQLQEENQPLQKERVSMFLFPVGHYNPGYSDADSRYTSCGAQRNRQRRRNGIIVL